MASSSSSASDALLNVLAIFTKPHPWHGLSEGGGDFPNEFQAFIECTPHDSLKFEVDKGTGYLTVDRPHKFSSSLPALYGFIPRTCCMQRVAKLCTDSTGIEVVGDGDPLDVLVLTSCALSSGGVTLRAKPIGGFRMIDGGEADDKIVAVLKDDPLFGEYQTLNDLPEHHLKKLKHYFLTYKLSPDGTDGKKGVEIPEVYGPEKALECMLAAQLDYNEHYGDMRRNAIDGLLEVLKEAPSAKRQKK